MATQPFNFDVFVKGPLTVGTDLAPTKIKATLHLEQPQDETAELARFMRTVGGGADSIGLKIDLPGGLPNLQGLTAADAPGRLGLNQQGGDLQLGSAGSQISIPGALTVAGTVNGRMIDADGVKLDTHVANMNNPHGVSALQIGALPLVGGELTGALTMQGDLTVQGRVNGRMVADDGAKLDDHVTNKANPHGVTADQVGALPVAGGTLKGALTVQGDLTVQGTINGRVLAADGAKLDSHVVNMNNPHAVTADQVGALPLVGGELTGALTVQGDLTVQGRTIGDDRTKLDNHLLDKANPHGTTADQVGALSLTGGTLKGALMVQGALTTSGAVNGRNLVADGTNLDKHLADKANPHSVTAQQVGALPLGGGTLTGTLNGRDIAADGIKLDTHLANRNNPHGVTAQQIRALPISGGVLTGSLAVSGSLGVGVATPSSVGLEVRANAGRIVGNGLYFYSSGNHTDNLPMARLTESWGMRYTSPDSRWVLSSGPSVLVGFQPDGRNWGSGNLLVSGNVGIGTIGTEGYKLSIGGTRGITDVQLKVLHLASDLGLRSRDKLNLIKFGTDGDYQVLHKASGNFHRNTLAMHVDQADAFGVYSTGWRPLLEVAGGSGDVYIKGNVGIGLPLPAFPLHMANGALCDGRTWRDASSITYKKDVAPLTLDQALETFNNLNSVTFRYKDEDDVALHTGFIAEEVPDLVASKDRKGLSALEIVSVLVRVVQHLNDDLETLRRHIKLN